MFIFAQVPFITTLISLTTYKRRKATSGQATKHTHPWKYETVMSFIIPHIGERRQISNLSIDLEESNESSQMDLIPEKKKY